MSRKAIAAARRKAKEKNHLRRARKAARQSLMEFLTRLYHPSGDYTSVWMHINGVLGLNLNPVSTFESVSILSLLNTPLCPEFKMNIQKAIMYLCIAPVEERFEWTSLRKG